MLLVGQRMVMLSLPQEDISLEQNKGISAKKISMQSILTWKEKTTSCSGTEAFHTSAHENCDK